LRLPKRRSHRRRRRGLARRNLQLYRPCSFLCHDAFPVPALNVSTESRIFGSALCNSCFVSEHRLSDAPIRSNQPPVVTWLLQMKAAKTTSIPSGMKTTVTTNGQTRPPCAFIKRQYLSSVERAPEPSERGDRPMTTFMYVRVRAPTANRTMPKTNMRTKLCDIAIYSRN
jgi:hypothetical protein